MPSFTFNEEYLSHMPALKLLVNLGYTYLTQKEALEERQGKTNNVLLENILKDSLKKINCIQHKGGEYLFSEENIQSAILKLKDVKFDGLVRTNEVIFDLLTLGTSQEQIINGDTRSFNFNYIDWKNPENNVFHVSPEFSVERTRSTVSSRPDIVLFVNGIPFCVIECKSPNIEVEKAREQIIGYQSDENIPRLFTYAQMVVGTNKNKVMYGTTGTPKNFWAIWKEKEDKPEDLNEIVNMPLDQNSAQKILYEDFPDATKLYSVMQLQGEERLVTEQDRILNSLCRPKRLLELAYHFTLFDGGKKKIARYQQYFVIKSTIKRIQQVDDTGKRKGGIIWHTQGSGKSLTMVMLARNLAMEAGISNPRIVLVTDRDDLDKQLGNTFKACGFDAKRASSGRNLLELISENEANLVTTLIHKFDKAMNVRKFVEESKDVFLLVDEAHRSHYKTMHVRMKQMLPNACYIGFTGTPLLKEEKNSFAKFGELLEPHYPITEAVEDGAVLPLLYEGRHVELKQDKKAIDLWFERHTQGLSKAQQADLKKKYSRAETLNKSEQVLFMQAFDISEHYRANWQGTGFKGQLVAAWKDDAVKLHRYLNELGIVTSEVVISSPDMRSGYDEVDEEPTDEVVKFWKKMMNRFGSEEEYTKQIINQFKNGEHPEILIVRDKLLTGFDAPKNAVLYLTRTLKEHTLLQAIARVNRLCEKKKFGYIVDYARNLGELDSALEMYSAFEGYDPEDLEGTLHSINTEVDKLPEYYSHLWDIFKTIKNKQDEEEFEQFLADEEIRHDFYQRLTDFSQCFSIAMSTQKFIENIDEKKLSKYKSDLKRFMKLRKSVKLRYAETIDFGDYEPKIKKLLDTHIQADEVYQLNEPVNIFDQKAFELVKEDGGVFENKSKAAKADAIAHATKKTITEKMDEDPAFYEKFSKLIQEAIDAFKAQRISDIEYLEKVLDIRDKVVTKKHDDLPLKLEGNENAQAFYGVIAPFFEGNGVSHEEAVDVATSVAIECDSLIKNNHKIQFWDDEDAQKDVINQIDDYLFDVVKGEKGIELSIDQIDGLIEKVMTVAKHRSGK